MICYMHTLVHKFQTSFTVLILFTTAQEKAQQQGHCPSGRFSENSISACITMSALVQKCASEWDAGDACSVIWYPLSLYSK